MSILDFQARAKSGTLQMGNLYDQCFELHLGPKPCPNTACDCFIGYVHREDLPVGAGYAGGELERVPHGARQ
ncbi:hypothetical protein C7S18_15630 [Ahniella affigens]|uniref:Uncharacterized protein n=1 Tax=Ahniella affigens TaxID=2021234 RepID=A0A2P1PUL2_9GAMM|nr:hypothetical protein C7S18_15630 [Ahniella affigens]